MSSALANNHNNNNDENNAPAGAMNGMAECPMYPYTAIPDESKFIDQQVISLKVSLYVGLTAGNDKKLHRHHPHVTEFFGEPSTSLSE